MRSRRLAAWGMALTMMLTTVPGSAVSAPASSVQVTAEEELNPDTAQVTADAASDTSGGDTGGDIIEDTAEDMMEDTASENTISDSLSDESMPANDADELIIDDELLDSAADSSDGVSDGGNAPEDAAIDPESKETEEGITESDDAAQANSANNLIEDVSPDDQAETESESDTMAGDLPQSAINNAQELKLGEDTAISVVKYAEDKNVHYYRFKAPEDGKYCFYSETPEDSDGNKRTDPLCTLYKLTKKDDSSWVASELTTYDDAEDLDFLAIISMSAGEEIILKFSTYSENEDTTVTLCSKKAPSLSSITCAGQEGIEGIAPINYLWINETFDDGSTDTLCAYIAEQDDDTVSGEDDYGNSWSVSGLSGLTWKNKEDDVEYHYLSAGNYTLTVTVGDKTRLVMLKVYTAEEYFAAHPGRVLSNQGDSVLAPANQESYIYYKAVSDQAVTFKYNFTSEKGEETGLEIYINGERKGNYFYCGIEGKLKTISLKKGDEVIFYFDLGNPEGSVTLQGDGITPESLEISGGQKGYVTHPYRDLTLQVTYSNGKTVSYNPAEAGNVSDWYCTDEYGNDLEISPDFPDGQNYFAPGTNHIKITAGENISKEYDVNIIKRLEDPEFVSSHQTVNLSDVTSSFTVASGVKTVILKVDENNDYQIKAESGHPGLSDADEQSEPDRKTGADTNSIFILSRGGTYLLDFDGYDIDLEKKVEVDRIPEVSSITVTGADSFKSFYQAVHNLKVQVDYASELSGGETCEAKSLYSLWLYSYFTCPLTMKLTKPDGTTVTKSAPDGEALSEENYPRGEYRIVLASGGKQAEKTFSVLTEQEYIISCSQPLSAGTNSLTYDDDDEDDNNYYKFTAPEDGVYVFRGGGSGSIERIDSIYDSGYLKNRQPVDTNGMARKMGKDESVYFWLRSSTTLTISKADVITGSRTVSFTGTVEEPQYLFFIPSKTALYTFSTDALMTIRALDPDYMGNQTGDDITTEHSEYLVEGNLYCYDLCPAGTTKADTLTISSTDITVSDVQVSLKNGRKITTFMLTPDGSDFEVTYTWTKGGKSETNTISALEHDENGLYWQGLTIKDPDGQTAENVLTKAGTYAAEIKFAGRVYTGAFDVAGKNESDIPLLTVGTPSSTKDNPDGIWKIVGCGETVVPVTSSSDGGYLYTKNGIGQLFDRYYNMATTLEEGKTCYVTLRYSAEEQYVELKNQNDLTLSVGQNQVRADIGSQMPYIFHTGSQEAAYRFTVADSAADCSLANERAIEGQSFVVNEGTINLEADRDYTVVINFASGAEKKEATLTIEQMPPVQNVSISLAEKTWVAFSNVPQLEDLTVSYTLEKDGGTVTRTLTGGETDPEYGYKCTASYGYFDNNGKYYYHGWTPYEEGGYKWVVSFAGQLFEVPFELAAIDFSNVQEVSLDENGCLVKTLEADSWQFYGIHLEKGEYGRHISGISNMKILRKETLEVVEPSLYGNIYTLEEGDYYISVNSYSTNSAYFTLCKVQSLQEGDQDLPELTVMEQQIQRYYKLSLSGEESETAVRISSTDLLWGSLYNTAGNDLWISNGATYLLQTDQDYYLDLGADSQENSVFNLNISTELVPQNLSVSFTGQTYSLGKGLTASDVKVEYDWADADGHVTHVSHTADKSDDHGFQYTGIRKSGDGGWASSFVLEEDGPLNLEILFAGKAFTQTVTVSVPEEADIQDFETDKKISITDSEMHYYRLSVPEGKTYQVTYDDLSLVYWKENTTDRNSTCRSGSSDMTLSTGSYVLAVNKSYASDSSGQMCVYESVTLSAEEMDLTVLADTYRCVALPKASSEQMVKIQAPDGMTVTLNSRYNNVDISGKWMIVSDGADNILYLHNNKNEDQVFHAVLEQADVPADLALEGPGYAFAGLHNLTVDSFHLNYTDAFGQKVQCPVYGDEAELYVADTSWTDENGASFYSYDSSMEGTEHTVYFEAVLGDGSKTLQKAVTVYNPAETALSLGSESDKLESGKPYRFNYASRDYGDFIIEVLSGTAKLYIEDVEDEPKVLNAGDGGYSFYSASGQTKLFGVLPEEEGTVLRVRKAAGRFTVKVTDNTVWTGSEITPELEVTDEQGNAVSADDYTVKYENNVEPGTAAVTLIGTGNYAGYTGSAEFTINKRSLEDDSIEVVMDNSTVTYHAQDQEPSVSVTYEDKTLAEGTDFISTVRDKDGNLTWAAPKNAGTYTIRLEGAGDHYTGSRDVTFTIMPAELTDENTTLSGDIGMARYDADSQSVKNADIEVSWGDSALTAGTDYTVSWTVDATKALATATITGCGNFTGTLNTTRKLINPWVEDSSDLNTLNGDGSVAPGDDRQLVRLEPDSEELAVISFTTKDGADDESTPDESVSAQTETYPYAQLYALDTEDQNWKSIGETIDPQSYTLTNNRFYALPVGPDVSAALLLPSGAGIDVWYSKKPDLTGQTGCTFGTTDSIRTPLLLKIDEEEGWAYRFDANTAPLYMKEVTVKGHELKEKTHYYGETGSCQLDLEQGVHYYQFSAYETANTIRVTRLAKPDAVSNLKGTALVCEAGLSWNVAVQADVQYLIYRRAEGETEFTQIAEIKDRETSSYRDMGLEGGKTYEYKVVAVIGNYVRSTDSDVVSVTTLLDTTAPSVAMDLSGEKKVGAEAEVSISASDNIGLAALAFYIRKEPEDDSTIGTIDSETLKNWQEIYSEDITSQADETIKCQTPAIDLNEITDGRYQVMAAAKDMYGNIGHSDAAVWIIDHTGPAQPAGLTGTYTDVSVTLMWGDVADEDRTSYLIEKQEEDGSWTTVADCSTLGFNLTGLVPGTTIICRVSAVDDIGNIGTPSEAITITTDQDKLAPVITAYTPDSMRTNKPVNFTATAKDEYSISRIRLQTSANGSDWADLDGAEQDYAADAPEETRTYSYTLDESILTEGDIYVRAIATDWYGNESDTSSSAPFRYYTYDLTAPGKPAGVTIAKTTEYETNGNLIIGWNRGTEKDLGAYTLERTQTPDDENSWAVLRTGYFLSYLDSSTEYSQTYYYRVKVADQAGNESEYSDVVSQMADPDTTAPTIDALSPADGSRVAAAGTDEGDSERYVTLTASAMDEGHIGKAIFQWKTGEDSAYTSENSLSVQAQGSTAELLSAEVPVSKLTEGETTFCQVTAEDASGNVSEPYSGSFILDMTAPQVKDAKAELAEDESYVTISWNGEDEEDLYCYAVYRLPEKDNRTLIWTGGKTSGQTAYSYVDKGADWSGLSGKVSYLIQAVDEVGNVKGVSTNEITLPDNSQEPEHIVPTPSLESANLLSLGADYVFDARGSSSDTVITEYTFDFGDGSDVESSSLSYRTHRYSQSGNYTVRLTVKDEDGDTAETQKIITVRDKTTLSDVRITVTDENGKGIANAAVYLDLGTDTQVMLTADSTGILTTTAGAGHHTIGSYVEHYLPASKEAVLLAGESAEINLTLKKDELVTGKFEVTRLTLEQILALGIDPADPANQNVSETTVHMVYRDMEYDLTFDYNDDGEIVKGNTLKIDDRILIPSVIPFPDGNGTGGGSEATGGGSGVFRGSSHPLIVCLDIPVTASALKEFFDVKLHVLNHAAAGFDLNDCKVQLNVPDGLSLIPTSSTAGAESVNLGTIPGQSNKTAEWILRGDDIGEYTLTADFQGVLSQLNVPIRAQFKSDEPVRVVGMSDCELKIVIPRYITTENGGKEAYLDYSLEFRNNGTVPVCLPNIALRKGDIYPVKLKDGTSYKYEYHKCDGSVDRLNIFPDTLNGGEYLSMQGRYKLDSGYANYELVNYYTEVANSCGLKISVLVDDEAYQDNSIIFKKLIAGTINGDTKYEETLLKGTAVNINGRELVTDAEGAVYLPDDFSDPVLDISSEGYVSLSVNSARVLGSVGTHAVILQVKDEARGPMIGSVYYRKTDKDGKKGEWKDAFLNKSTANEGDDSRYELEVTVDWKRRKPGKVIARLDDRHMAVCTTAADGSENRIYKFTDVEFSEWTDGLYSEGNIYIYAESAEGEIGTLRKTEISVSKEKSPLEQLANLKIKLDGDIEVTLPDDFPVIGGSKIALSLMDSKDFPFIFNYENGKIQIGINLEGDKAWGDHTVRPSENERFTPEQLKKYRVFKKLMTSIADYKDDVAQYNKLKQLFTNEGNFKTFKISNKAELKYGFMGYIEGTLTENGMVLTGGQFALSIEVSGSVTKQFIKPPVYIAFTIGGKGSAVGVMARPIASPEIPIEWDVETTVEPYLKATGGIGIKDAIGVELTGGISLKYNHKWLTGYRKLTGTSTVTLKAYIGPMKLYEQDLYTSEKVLWEKNGSKDTAGAKPNVAGEEDEETSGTGSLLAEAYNPANYVPKRVANFRSELLTANADSTAGSTDSTGISDGAADSISGETGSNEDVILQNAYPDSRLSVMENGTTKMMVWLSQDNDRTAANSSVVVFSVYDKAANTWSEAQIVDDDGTADLYPRAYVQDNRIYVIWQNTTKQLAEDASLTDLGENSELKTAVYDLETGSFTDMEEIAPENSSESGETGTDNKTLYSDPKYASDGRKLYAVWTVNDSGDFFGTTGSNSLMAAEKTDDGWSTPSVLANNLGMILSYDAAVINGTLYAAASVDTDGDIQTDTDWEIIKSQWTAEDGYPSSTWLTEDTVTDSSPVFVSEAVSGQSQRRLSLLWNHDSTTSRLVLTDASQAAEDAKQAAKVEDIGLTAASGRRQLDTAHGNYLLWIGESASDPYAKEIYCSAYNESDGTYGQPVAVTGLNRFIISFQAMEGDDGDIDIVYQGSTVTVKTDENGEKVPSYGASNVYRCEIDPQPDLSVENNKPVIEDKIFPQAPIHLDLTISNNGLSTAAGYIVQLIENDSRKIVMTRNFRQVLESGRSTKCELTYILPINFSGKSYTVKVSLTSGRESSLDNNSFDLDIPGSALELSSLATERSGENVVLTAKFLNTGAVDLTNIQVKVHEDKADNPELSGCTATISSIPIGRTKTVNLTVPLKGLSYWSNEKIECLYVTAEDDVLRCTGCTAVYFNPDAKLEMYILDRSIKSDGVGVSIAVQNGSGEEKKQDIVAAVLDKEGSTAAYKVVSADVGAGLTDIIETTIPMEVFGDQLPDGYTLTVVPMTYVETIALDQEEAKISRGSTWKLNAAISPDTAFDQKITWTSSDEKVATVDEDGTVTAVANGKATITAAARDTAVPGGSEAKAACEVSVVTDLSDAAKTALTIEPEASTYGKDEPAFTVSWDGETVSEDNYTLSFEKAKAASEDPEQGETWPALEQAPVDAGTYRVTAAGKEDKFFTGTVSGTYTIAPYSLEEEASGVVIEMWKSEKTGTSTVLMDTAAEDRPVPTVTVNGKALTYGTDYTVVFAQDEKPGENELTITGIGNYSTKEGGIQKKYTALKNGAGIETTEEAVKTTKTDSGITVSADCFNTGTEKSERRVYAVIVDASGNMVASSAVSQLLNLNPGSKATVTLEIPSAAYSGLTENPFDENGNLINGYSVQFQDAGKCTHIGNTTETYTVDKEAACAEPGSESIHCSVCGKSIESTSREIPATGRHTYGEWKVTKAPTCVAAGKRVNTCSVCADTITETIPATGRHSYTGWKVTRKATVFAPAQETGRCSVCGRSSTRSTGSKLTPFITLNVSGTLPMKTKQKTTSVKVTGLAKGDHVVSWKSSSTSVVKVSASGKLTAGKKAGKTAVITVRTAAGARASFKVKLQKAAVKTSKLVVSTREIRLKRKAKYTVAGKVYPITSSDKIKYSSSNKKIVTVSSKGVITARKNGKATISVTAGKKKVKIKVTVK